MVSITVLRKSKKTGSGFISDLAAKDTFGPTAPKSLIYAEDAAPWATLGPPLSSTCAPLRTE